MKQGVRREIYLWQAILIFVCFTSLLYATGYFLKDNILALYYNSSFFTEDYDPVLKIDRQMISLERKIRENPNVPNDYLQLGWIYYKKGAPKEAIKVYLMALNLEPEHVGVLYNLGLIYMEQNNYTKAENNFTKILKKHPDHELAGLSLVKLYYINRRYKEADQLLKDLKPYMAANADYFYYLGLVSDVFDKMDEAANAYKKALRLDPNFTEARKRLDNVEKQK